MWRNCDQGSGTLSSLALAGFRELICRKKLFPAPQLALTCSKLSWALEEEEEEEEGRRRRRGRRRRSKKRKRMRKEKGEKEDSS